MQKKLKLYLISSILILVIVGLVIKGNYSDDHDGILAKVNKGDFNVEVMVTGELEAKNSVKIYGPSGLRRYKIYDISIQSILEEGELVKKGQEIAKLDPSNINSRLQDAILELEEADARFQQSILDTTLDMRQARDKLVGLKFSLEEKRLDLQQAQFDPPLKTKRNKMAFDKAQKTYEMSLRNLKILKNKNDAAMRQVTARRKRKQSIVDGLNKIASKCSVLAPSDGMLIYFKKSKQVIKEGSKISTWDPVIATLPDLSTMLSIAYVNEIDIRKIKKGQKVKIELDALPNQSFSGKIIKVANVAEQRPKSDAKFFAIKIEIKGNGDMLRPAMTTSNKIIIKQLMDVIHVPIECIHSLNDSLTYVYKQVDNDIFKQEVRIGDINDTDVVILEGLKEGELLFMSEFDLIQSDNMQFIEI